MEKNKPIQLTEQDLHMLVEDSVRTYLKENGMEEGIWGGLKNVASGMRQGNFFIGQNYKFWLFNCSAIPYILVKVAYTF